MTVHPESPKVDDNQKNTTSETNTSFSVTASMKINALMTGIALGLFFSASLVRAGYAEALLNAVLRGFADPGKRVIQMILSAGMVFPALLSVEQFSFSTSRKSTTCNESKIATPSPAPSPSAQTSPSTTAKNNIATSSQNTNKNPSSSNSSDNSYNADNNDDDDDDEENNNDKEKSRHEASDCTTTGNTIQW